jgi:hypothetical protein
VSAIEPPLDIKVVRVARALDDADLPFAFGGALALAYYAEPRATIDLDVNVFVAPAAIARVTDALLSVGVAAGAADLRAARRVGAVRLWWDTTPIDVFLAYDAFHFSAAKRVRVVPFGPDAIRILAAEDLLVCKVIFDRRKDWIDVEQMLLLNAGSLDVADVRRWIAAIVGEHDRRRVHFDGLVGEVLGPQYPF